MTGQWAHRGGERQASVVIREAQINTNMRHYCLTPCRMAIKREEEGEREGGGWGEGKKRGRREWWLEWECPSWAIYLNICFLFGGTAWEGLKGVALLEEVCHWR